MKSPDIYFMALLLFDIQATEWKLLNNGYRKVNELQNPICLKQKYYTFT